jgi:hypothetical protein
VNDRLASMLRDDDGGALRLFERISAVAARDLAPEPAPCGAWYGAMFIAGVVGAGLALVVVTAQQAACRLARR